jgi:MFS family permease
MNSKPSFLTNNVAALSVVSLLADASTEMIIPVLPLFLVGVLGSTYSFVGLIEGSADSVSSLIKVVSGIYSDRIGKRKSFTVIGYTPTAFLKPLLYFAQTPLQVLAIRIPERVGKGVRGSPRDALIAESVDKAHLGKAFGFHRAFDTVGAIAGSVIGFVLLTSISGSSNASQAYRTIFMLSAIPAVASVIVAQIFVKEIVAKRKADNSSENNEDGSSSRSKKLTNRQFLLDGFSSFDARLKFFIIISSIFAFANFNISFFILKANSLGISNAEVVLLYVLYNAVYAAVSYPFGGIADRIGRDRAIMISFAIFIATTIGFALYSNSLTSIVILFASLGVYMGIFDGSQKSYVSEIAPASFKATALGTIATLTGIITLPSSLVAGILWDKIGPATTFEFAAVTASAALIFFIVIQQKFRH